MNYANAEEEVAPATHPAPWITAPFGCGNNRHIRPTGRAAPAWLIDRLRGGSRMLTLRMHPMGQIWNEVDRAENGINRFLRYFDTGDPAGPSSGPAAYPQ